MRNFIVVIIILIGLIFIWYIRAHPQFRAQNLVNNQIISISSPTPMPYEEITIPALRTRTYQSNLGNLEKYTDNGNYTSYLTSYSSDGLKINGLLTKPTGVMPVGGWPAIVFIHGYIPPNQYQTTQRYVEYVDYLARNGFVVFKIDLRGHGNSEGQAHGAYYSSDYEIDTLNAYSALQNSNFVNPREIGLWGHSMAGNIVMRSFAIKPDIPAVVIWAGAGYTYVDLAQWGIKDPSYQPGPNFTNQANVRQRLSQLYGSPKDGNPFWKQVAPASYLNDLKGAIQLNQAVDDETVSIEYNRNLNKLLDQTSVPHEFHEYPTGGHNITDPSFTPAMENTVAFFKKYLVK